MSDIVLGNGPGVPLAHNFTVECISPARILKLAKEWKATGVTYVVLDDAQSKSANIINACLLSGIQIWVSYHQAPEPVTLRRLKDSGVSAVIVPAERIEVMPSTVKRITRNNLACIITQDVNKGAIYSGEDAKILRSVDAYGILSSLPDIDTARFFIGEGFKFYTTNISLIKDIKKISGHGFLSPLVIGNTKLSVTAWSGDILAQNNLIQLSSTSIDRQIKDSMEFLS